MENERVKCPSCHGLRCLFGLGYDKDDNLLYVCTNYNLHKKCREHDSSCLLRCSVCNGTGVVDWVDQYFRNNDPYKERFDNIVEFLKDKKKYGWIRKSAGENTNIGRRKITKFYKDIYGE